MCTQLRMIFGKFSIGQQSASTCTPRASNLAMLRRLSGAITALHLSVIHAEADAAAKSAKGCPKPGYPSVKP
jgi:hypothetical protein